MKMKNIITVLCLGLCTLGFSQTYQWNGDSSDDFFDENNWIDSSTNMSPAIGSIDLDTAINADLIINNASQTIYANGLINLGNGSLTLENAEISGVAISNGELILNKDAYVALSDANPLQNNIEIQLNSQIAWLRLWNVKPAEMYTNFITQIQVNQQTATYQTNLRLDNYYANGCIVRAIESSDKPLKIYDLENLQGNSAELDTDIIWSSQSLFDSQPIPNGLDNSIESLVLKKGFMLTLAVNEDGTGRSKNYIASENDLVINNLPSYLKNSISFIRVLPWNWATKKGRGGGGTSALLDNSWFYQWNNTLNSTLELEYTPMAWGAGGANDNSDIENYIDKNKVTHVLAFNESDNCNDQSGQYNNLCQTDVAIGYYKNLMKTGLRLVSPSGRENAPFGWLKEFYDKANAQDIRIDAIGVHWYDWGSNPANSPNANASAVFNRFVNYLENVHDLYGLPIWITEFNANPNRTNQVNYEFMQLALPYLESLDYVERYAWFEPNSDVADYTDTNGNLTNVGNFYTNQTSTPAIPEAVWTENNNLDHYLAVVDPTGQNLIVNGFFETEDLFGWEGSNIGVLTNNEIYEGTTSGRILANAGELYQVVEVKPNTQYDLSFYTRWFVTPNNVIDVQILNAEDNSLIADQTMTTNTNWNLVEMQFITPTGVNHIKLVFEKGDEPGWFIDNAVMFESETLSTFQTNDKQTIKIFPNPTSRIFTVQSTQKLEAIAIYNLKGQLVKEVNNLNGLEINVDVQELSNGIYIIKTISALGRHSILKILKS